MKWRKGDTGNYHFLTTYTGRKKGRTVRVTEAGKSFGKQEAPISWWYFISDPSGKYPPLNSCWTEPGTWPTAEEAMAHAEAYLDSLPK